jgi:hypothetical protein
MHATRFELHRKHRAAIAALTGYHLKEEFNVAAMRIGVAGFIIVLV